MVEIPDRLFYKGYKSNRMMSLNNVEKSLANVNIALRDSANSFRPLEDVIDDVGKRWGEFSEVQQAQIANAIAG